VLGQWPSVLSPSSYYPTFRDRDREMAHRARRTLCRISHCRHSKRQNWRSWFHKAGSHRLFHGSQGLDACRHPNLSIILPNMDILLSQHCSNPWIRSDYNASSHSSRLYCWIHFLIREFLNRATNRKTCDFDRMAPCLGYRWQCDGYHIACDCRSLYRHGELFCFLFLQLLRAERFVGISRSLRLPRRPALSNL
jgi:hypothetical protein